MEKSSSIVNLAKALKQFHANVGKIKKENNNPFFNSKYADLSTILDAIKQPLLEADLSFTQFPEGCNTLVTTLMHAETGEYMEASYTLQPVKNDPQAQGSVITYMRRYALAAVLGLNLDEDDDGNRATHGKATPQEKVWLEPNSKEYKEVCENLKKKLITIPDLYNTFKLSKNVKAELEEYVKTLQPGYVEAQQEQAAANAEKPWLDKNSKKWDLIVERLKNKTTTLSQVATYFKLNKEVRAELQSIVNDATTTPAAPVTTTTAIDADLSMWESMVEGIETVENMKEIYRLNKAAIDASPAITQLFADKKKQLEKKN